MTGGGFRALLAQGKRSFWLLFGGIWLVAGAIMLVVGIGMALDERRWEAAVETTGMVLTKDFVPADSDSSTEYRVGFRYTTESGATAEGDQRIDVHGWEALTERGPITVYYLPGSSEPPRLDPSPEPFGPLIFLAAGILLGGVGGFLFFRTLRNVLRSERLMRTGTRGGCDRHRGRADRCLVQPTTTVPGALLVPRRPRRHPRGRQRLPRMG